MSQKSERVKQMIDGFMPLHEKGYSIPEIAEMFELSYATGYKYWQEIADKNGMKRQDLLQILSSTKGDRNRRDDEKKVRIDIKKLEDGFSEVHQAISKLSSLMDNIMEEMKNEESDC